MPDVTPKPLRSKANAVINLMGAVGGVIYLAVTAVLYPTAKVKEMAHVNYHNLRQVSRKPGGHTVVSHKPQRNRSQQERQAFLDRRGKADPQRIFHYAGDVCGLCPGGAGLGGD